MNPVALSNPIPQSKSLATPYTYLGRGEMADILSPHTCSLCGVVVTNFRIVHPIMRYDASRPYFHRTGRNRGLSPERRIGWSCGKHRTIDPHWLENSHTLGVDAHNVSRYDLGMVTEKPRPAVLEEARHKLELSRAKMAQAMGVDTSTIYVWETGKRRVPDWAIKFVGFLLSNAKAVDNA